MNFDQFIEPIVRIGMQAWLLLSRLLASLLVIAIGVIVAWLIRSVVSRALALARFDRLCDRMGIRSMLARGGLAVAPSRLMGGLFAGIVIVVAIALSVSTLDETLAHSLLERLLRFLPNLFIAVVLFIVGALLAKFLQRGVLIALVNAQFPGARLVSGAVGIGIMVFVLALALEQVGLAARVVVAAFSILFGGVVIALSIAFGLAGRDLARDLLEHYLHKPPSGDEHKDQISHL
ncbi:MAG: hypothetical protein AB1714_10640 [Acidobacteriota bacterium]